jgi:ABC-type transport system involved in multi-copper enzyme maturation permease subunit
MVLLNTVIAELTKAGKSKIFILGTIIVLAMPILIIIKDYFVETHVAQYVHYTDWLMTGLSLNGVVLPVISGFIITVFIQREYQENTIINILTSPVSRMSFVISKYIVWLLWYCVTLFMVMVLYTLGYFLIYSEAFDTEGVTSLLRQFSKYGMGSFVASSPLLWLTIKQKKAFYPSIFAALFFTTIQIAAFNASTEMLPLISIVPWSAVIPFTFGAPKPFIAISVIAIVCVGALGLLLSCYTFNKQDQ